MDNIYEEERKSIPLLVTNVGSVDFKETGDNDTERIYDEYIDMVEKLKILCPAADIVVSSIIPRRGEDRFCKVNQDIADVNTRLHDRCKNSVEFHFCDNSDVVLDESHNVRKDCYQDNIHLTPTGRKDLCRSIFKKVKEVYFKRQMCQVCAKIVCASPEKKAEQTPQA